MCSVHRLTLRFLQVLRPYLSLAEWMEISSAGFTTTNGSLTQVCQGIVRSSAASFYRRRSD